MRTIEEINIFWEENMRTIEEINADIERTKEELENVHGTQTEVYARIVGYYRSVRNWNKGKREEYNHRKLFVPNAEETSEYISGKGNCLIENDSSCCGGNAAAPGAFSSGARRFFLKGRKNPGKVRAFFQDSLPQLPACKGLLRQLLLQREDYRCGHRDRI